MEQDSSFNKQLRKETTARAVKNEIIRVLETDIVKNYEKIDDISRETNKLKRTIRRRRHKFKNVGNFL